MRAKPTEVDNHTGSRFYGLLPKIGAHHSGLEPMKGTQCRSLYKRNIVKKYIVEGRFSMPNL